MGFRRGVVLALAALGVPACGGDGGGGGGGGPGVIGNQPPGVVLSAPSGGATFTEGSDVPLEAQITDADGFVTRVDFFRGATRIGSDLAWPFELTWTSVPAGSFSLTAVATDDAGADTRSVPVAITVTSTGGGPPPNQPPTVRITSPPASSSVQDGYPMMLEAEASDAEGPVARVEFFDGTDFLGSATSAPFRVAWTATPVGFHSIQAVATDVAGASTSSDPVAVTVTAVAPPPTFSPPTGSLNGVFFATTSRGWIVGDQGHIWRSDDGGSSWTAQTSGTTSWLSRVQFVNATTGWAVGGDGTILKTVNGGDTWTRLNSGTVSFLAGLSFVSGSTGWVVGNDDTILKTVDGGSTWTSQASGSPNSWSAISFVSPAKGWIGGIGEVLSTTDGGATWAHQAATIPTSTVPRAIGLNDARFLSDTRGTMVGFTAAVVDAIRTTTDGGATWNLRSNTSGSHTLLGVAFGDARHLWAVGPGGAIVASTDAGDTWFVQPGPTSATLRAVWAVSATTAWAVGDSGTVIRTTNGGSTWILLSGGT